MLGELAEFLPYRSQRINVGYEYGYQAEWIEKPWRVPIRSGPKVISARPWLKLISLGDKSCVPVLISTFIVAIFYHHACI
jgi:hypothetical protein